jgi:cell division protease FtsH
MKTLLFYLFSISFVQGFFRPFYPQNYLLNNDPFSKKYPISQNYYNKFLKRIQPNNTEQEDIVKKILHKNAYKYPLSQNYYENFIKRLNSRNITDQTNEIMGSNDDDNGMQNKTVRIVINKHLITTVSNQLFDPEMQNNGENGDYEDDDFFRKRRRHGGSKKSENFEVITECLVNFTHVGGYEPIKKELMQCVDLLSNFTKYAKFNVRVPKGLIFEGPPGNGKTLLAKALAGEAKTGFIAVSGSQFQEKYVGVGSSRIRELFQLAEKNIPCIIFIDEIDALGRNRGSDKETSSAERDNTLNELLVALDGFKTKAGTFIIGATNRIDLLDPALTRPGRIDKRIFIGNPDEAGRHAIIEIHSQGKPRDITINNDDLVEITNGFSAAQIENLLNEAMLHALRENREQFTQDDIDVVYNKVLVGWQPSEHIFTDEMLDKICIHEMGHAIVGLMSHNHSNVKKVIINLSSPNSPGYTLFEKSNTNIYNRDTLFEHLMILLGGRIAEELFYGHLGVSTGAISDFEEALTLANKMITYYGMGDMAIYPSHSEKYKELIDNEITKLLQDAYAYSYGIINESKDFIYETALLLKKNRMLTANELMELVETKYPDILNIRY